MKIWKILHRSDFKGVLILLHAVEIPAAKSKHDFYKRIFCFAETIVGRVFGVKRKARGKCQLLGLSRSLLCSSSDLPLSPKPHWDNDDLDDDDDDDDDYNDEEMMMM